MKKPTRSAISLALLAVVAFVAVSACDLFTTPVTIKNRLDNFVAELNKADRSSVYLQLDSSATSYSAAKAASFWDALFAKETYSITDIVDSNPEAVTAKLTGNGTFGTQTITFGMSKTGTVNLIYTIKSINFGGKTVFN